MSVSRERGLGRQPWRFIRSLIADQRIRFLAVGAINTGVGYGLFVVFDLFVFHNVAFGYLGSLALSYAGAIVLAFILYRRFVFKVSGQLLTDFFKFCSVYLVIIGVNAVALPVLVELVGLNSLIAQAIVLVCTTLMSFFGHRGYSFSRPTKS